MFDNPDMRSYKWVGQAALLPPFNRNSSVTLISPIDYNPPHATQEEGKEERIKRTAIPVGRY